VTIQEFLPLLVRPRKCRDGYMARCPGAGHKYGDRHPSLSVKNAGDRILLKCFADCPVESVVRAMGLTMADLFSGPKNNGNGHRRIVRTYDYIKQGKLLYQKLRYEPKDFSYRRPDGKGSWIWSIKDIERCLYRHDVVAGLEPGATVIYSEGEKDVETAESLGLIATTAGGAKNWRLEFSEAFRGHDLIIAPHNDPAGLASAEQVARDSTGIAASVRVLPPLVVIPCGDLSDFVEQGGTREELLNLALETPIWRSASPAADKLAVCLADVAPQSVDWLWKPYLPLGKLALIEGDPGLGKSWLTCAIATAVSRGFGLPGLAVAEPRNVLLMSAEDGLADTIRPRLDSMGADAKKIFAINDPLTFDEAGLIRIEAALATYRPTLVIIDPLVAFIGARVDIHRANETRTVMAKLAGLAERYACAIVGVRHLRKSSSDRAIYRGAGSIDFTAACRSVLLVGADPNDKTRRAVVHIKSNLAAIGESIGFDIDEHGFAWTGISDLTADDVLSPASNSQEASALDEAKEFLREMLATGPQLVSEIQKEAKSAGVNLRTLRRARESLAVQCNPSKNSDGKVEFWTYSLP
jgi:putative DNA primase/helicase